MKETELLLCEVLLLSNKTLIYAINFQLEFSTFYGDFTLKLFYY